jgi:predicted component of type VI protein secretion system
MLNDFKHIKIMQIALLKSLNSSTFQDFFLTPGELMIGRSPKSGIVLQDIRCSGFHCSITPQQTTSWQFLIKDLSSNGTFVNGLLVSFR